MKANDPKLEARVESLEKEVAALRGARAGFGIRTRSASGIGTLPWYDIALGPDLERGEWRGHARGVIAIGDLATGIVALGGLARGIVALGGLAVGLFSFGGLSIGLLSAVGGAAIGAVALGGGAAGGVAVGGGAAGYYACGGAAVGTHVISAREADADAQRFFDEYFAGSLCTPTRLRRQMR